ncbi:hypothetical protein ACOCG7_34415 (plasmid) [Paraburkholderia sp. DD10]|uniref:hypothetical protein n=1 Tax=Paraburkholderia sp. DD10 TaxID=3409691 RepID=UPI003BA33DAA
MKLTSRSLLRLMEPGKTYQADELAAGLDASTAQVNDMLCMLVEDGMVRMNSHIGRILRFERLMYPPGREASKDAQRGSVQSTVATQPITRTLTGSLQHYDSSLMQLRRLAMLARNGRP